MPLGKLGRLNHDAVPAIVTVEPSALAEPDQHRQVGLLPSIVLGDVMPTHPAMVACFAATGKPRGLVALAAGLDYIWAARLQSRRMSDVIAKLEEGRRTTDRVVVEILAARKSWALFEAFNGKDDAARAQLRVSVSALGVVTCANGIAMALVRDTLLALFRVSDAPGSDKLTLCRLSRALQDPGVVASLEQDARQWSARITPYSQKFAEKDAATCRRAISLITSTVPPKWDANSPPSDPRLFNLRTKLKDVRDHVIAHSVGFFGLMAGHQMSGVVRPRVRAR